MEKTVKFLIKLFEENRSDAAAGPMEKYMKNHFPFLGIKKPLRSEKTLTARSFLSRKQLAGHCGNIQSQILLR
jgi:3-methyladenine DNA glycosylase AlkD